MVAGARSDARLQRLRGVSVDIDGWLPAPPQRGRGIFFCVNALAAPSARRANIRDGAQGMGRSGAGGFACAVALAALALIASPAAAEPQGFPGKPVRIIVPYPPARAHPTT